MLASFRLAAILLLLLSFGSAGLSQTSSYPKELRGYKVEQRVVGVKKPSEGEKAPAPLLQLGEAQVATITPLGVSLEIPLIVSPVQQKGRVEFLVFENMVVNGTAVEIDEYHRAFDLPNKEPLSLKEPLKFYVYLPSAVLAALGEWSTSRPTWLVTGRVYVFGTFKKSILSFRRCIPLELSFTIQNPLRSQEGSRILEGPTNRRRTQRAFIQRGFEPGGEVSHAPPSFRSFSAASARW